MKRVKIEIIKEIEIYGPLADQILKMDDLGTLNCQSVALRSEFLDQKNQADAWTETPRSRLGLSDVQTLVCIQKVHNELADSKSPDPSNIKSTKHSDVHVITIGVT